MRHLMNPLDFSVEELDKLFALADDIEKDPAKYAHKCDSKILLLLREKVYPIPSASSPAMRTSVLCAIPRKALPW